VKLLDRYGRALPPLPRRPRSGPADIGATSGLYQTPTNTGEGHFYRPRQRGMAQLDSLLHTSDWLEILDLSRQLFSQLANLGYAVVQKNTYAVGDAWLPQYLGSNPTWGEEWLHHVWLPQCNYSGMGGGWQQDLFLSGVAWDVDGDDACIFVIDEGGFPKLAYRPAHQIGTGVANADQVKGGPFDGARISNGVIYDRDDRYLGLRLLKEGARPWEKTEWTDLPAANVDLRFEPVWRTQRRGLPKLAVALLDMMDVQDIKVFLKRGVKLANSIGLVQTNAEGEANPASDMVDEFTTDTSAQARDIKTEYRLGGEMMYMRAGIGEKIEEVLSKRPSGENMNFLRALERNGLLALGWFHELLDPSAVGGASVRLIQDQARHSVRARQRTLKGRVKRAILFAIGQAMSNGWLPRNGDAADWMKWDCSMPAQISVDNGYEEQADRENFVLGSETLAGISQKKGRWWEDQRRQKLAENKDLITKAKELVEHSKSSDDAEDGEDTGLSLREAIALMQGSSNAPEGLRAQMDKESATDPTKEDEPT
jgi:hypothetical protein